MRSPLATLGRALARAPEYVSTGNWSIPWIHRTGMVAYMQAYGQDGTLFPVVSQIATAVASPEWHLYRKAKSGKKEDRTEIADHLAIKVWNKPNPFFSRHRFMETVEQHINLTGEGWATVGYASKSATMRIPTELWPLRPDRCSPVPSEDEFLVGYTYVTPSGAIVPYGKDEMLNIILPNPMDVYRGLGPVQSILTNIDANRYSAEWNRNFFVNSAQPGGVIEFPNNLGDTEWKKFRERWAESHKGVANAHRVAILEGGAVWKDVAYSMRDMQFQELMAVAPDVIRRAFSLTKFDTGDIDDVNRATAVASEIRFAKKVIRPRLERWKGMLNDQYLPMFGSTTAGMELDYDDPAPEDDEALNSAQTAKAATAKTYIVDIGFEPEGVLEYLDLPKDWEIEEKEPPAPVPGVVPGAQPPAPGQPVAPPAEETAKARAFDLMRAMLEGRPVGRTDGAGDVAGAPFLYDAS